MRHYLTSKYYLFLGILISTYIVNAYNDVCISPAFGDGRSQQAILTTLYGDFIVTEPVLLELLQCPMMERLKKVRQYGVFYYAIKPIEFTRYDHSIGVFALLRRSGASLEEQIAGLLHDISHTVFSHGGGHTFHSVPLDADAHQDNNHTAFLRATGIEEILKKYGYTIDDIHHKNPLFICLERNLPHLCADRIEYNIHGGLAEGLITEQEAYSIVDSLIFENSVWFFVNQDLAKKFARISLWKTEFAWGSAEDTLVATWTGEMLKRALEIKLLKLTDVLCGTDDVVWQALTENKDEVIQKYMHKCMHQRELFYIDATCPDCVLYTKFRGIDPLVKTEQGLKHLSEIDEEFKAEFESLKQKIAQGWSVKFTEAQV